MKSWNVLFYPVKDKRVYHQTVRASSKKEAVAKVKRLMSINVPSFKGYFELKLKKEKQR